jgi:hypothetical protein
VIHGRKASRAHDGQMRDDVWDLAALRHDAAQRSSMPARWVPDAQDEPELEQYRPRFAGEEDRVARVCGHEATSSGVHRSTARRAPSPYTQCGGRGSDDMNATPVMNDEESFRREYFARDYVPLSQAPRQKRLDQTLQGTVFKERVAAWEVKTFDENDARPLEVFDAGEEALIIPEAAKIGIGPRAQDMNRASENNRARRQRPRREVVHLRVLTDARQSEILPSPG